MLEFQQQINVLICVIMSSRLCSHVQWINVLVSAIMFYLKYEDLITKLEKFVANIAITVRSVWPIWMEINKIKTIMIEFWLKEEILKVKGKPFESQSKSNTIVVAFSRD